MVFNIEMRAKLGQTSQPGKMENKFAYQVNRRENFAQKWSQKRRQKKSNRPEKMKGDRVQINQRM